MKYFPGFGLLALILVLPTVSTHNVAAEVPAEVRVLRRTLTPLVGILTNAPVTILEKQAPTKPSAALALAWRLAHANPADPAQGRRWVERAAEQGDPVAQYAAGALAADTSRDTDGEVLGDFETAREWWEKAAAQGHVLASTRLGDVLWNGSLGLLFLCWRPGSGLMQDCDPDTARKWLSAAARHGDSAADYALQYLVDWERRAAARQRPLREWLPAALRDLEIREFGWILGSDGPANPPPDFVKDESGLSKLARELKSAERHEVAELVRQLPESPQDVTDPAVRYRIAELLWAGTPSVSARPQKAIDWYLAAARAGHAPAMRRLGQLWEQGVGGQPDPDEARRWYRRAEAAEKTPAR